MDIGSGIDSMGLASSIDGSRGKTGGDWEPFILTARFGLRPDFDLAIMDGFLTRADGAMAAVLGTGEGDIDGEV